MQKNVAGQKWIVFAFDITDGTPKTGDAANITANIRLDGGGANEVDDTNPTELEDGYYAFDITQAECNADLLSLHPESSTSDIQAIGSPGAIYTRPPNFPSLGIESDGDITSINNESQRLFSLIESQRGSHTGKGQLIFWDPIGGNDSNSGLVFREPKLTYNFNGGGGVHSLMSANSHDIIIGLPNLGGGPTVVNEYFENDKDYNFFRGPGRNWQFKATHNETCAVVLSGEGCELSGCRVETKATGSQDAICASGDFSKLNNIWVDYSRGSGIKIDNASSCEVDSFTIQDSAQGGSGHALHILGDTSLTTRNIIGSGEIFENGNGGGGADGIRIDGVNCVHNFIHGGSHALIIHDNTGYGINEVNGADETIVVGPTVHSGHNTLGDINLTGASSTSENIDQWATNKDMQTALTNIDAIPTNPVNVISAINGSLQVEIIGDSGTIPIYIKTAMGITITLNKDMTGKKIFFALRERENDAYIIPAGGTLAKEITSTINLATGNGVVNLSAAETDIERKIYELGEIFSISDTGGDPTIEQLFKGHAKDHSGSIDTTP